MVLCGGQGTRLRSVVADRPKPMAMVGEQPFLARVLRQLRAAGCRHVVLCTGHLGEQIEAWFGASFEGMPLAYVRETEPRGTAGALRQAWSAHAAPAALVLNGYCRENQLR